MAAPTLELRDIHLPAPVSWWPLAPGWWLLLIAVLLAALGLVLWRRGAPTRRLRRAALAELAAIEAAYVTAGDGHACAAALSRLLHRLAVLARGSGASEVDYAALAATLGALRAGPPPAPLERVMTAAPYSPSAARGLAGDDYRAAVSALRPWLARLRAPAPGVPHAAL
ncbi:MAG: DUF4381 family protein [Gammaproteobacteria bacterium]